MIDSHTHLNSCREPASDLVERARAAGLTRILSVGMDAETCRRELANADAHPEVFVALGRHPNVAAGYDDAATDDLRTLAAHPKCVAIGETGLDYYREGAPPADQRRAFHAQLDLARETGKPVVIHTRAADEETIATLRDRGAGLAIVLHCFSMPDRIEECVAEGWWISFAGNATYPANADLLAAAAKVPLDQLLVETDAPYLTPVPHRKERNRPDLVVHTAAAVADARGATLAELDAAVTANAARLFGW